MIPTEQASVTDLVCGMDVDPTDHEFEVAHAGETVHFCSAGCQAKFVADPAKFAAAQKTAAIPPDAGAIYTCPMHPQIRQIGPGACPICGMALEPVIATAEAGPNPEFADMRRRFWIGLALSVPPVVLEMGGHLVGGHGWGGQTPLSMVT